MLEPEERARETGLHIGLLNNDSAFGYTIEHAASGEIVGRTYSAEAVRKMIAALRACYIDWLQPDWRATAIDVDLKMVHAITVTHAGTYEPFSIAMIQSGMV